MFKKNSAKVMLFLFFSYSTMTIFGTFLPIYFRENGLSGTEIGWLLAIGPIASIISQPVMGFLSDKYRSTKRTIVACLTGAIAISFILAQVDSFIGFFLVLFFFFFFISSVNPLGDSIARQTSEDEKVSFGFIRMWGSLGFGVTALVIGYVFTIIGIDKIFLAIIICLFVTLAIAFSITERRKTNKPVTLIDAVKMGLEPRLFVFLLVVMFIFITHRTNDNYLGLYIVELGGNESYIGLATFIGVASECLVLATGAFWFKKFHETTFIMIAGSLYSIRWFFMTVISDPQLLLVLQLLHGVTFGILFLSAFQYVSKILPKHLLATGHVLFFTILFGVTAMIGSLGGGMIIEFLSIKFLYFLLGISAAIGVLLTLLYRTMFIFKEKATRAKTEKMEI
ncbi:MFS transporter [Alkalihalobacillus sp. MEB130]|uniref:MFS transporter n=1 Tax=Alkalihalobacillus sp. MEB130 TaxID=2976704 RepID=UPI0028E0831D|nr:MFS transporter [Alkalihalobacillus sp. MEB130]MDT8862944.1 MFS transporter [Alkalihalobacillus sp. MEB130]